MASFSCHCFCWLIKITDPLKYRQISKKFVCMCVCVCVCVCVWWGGGGEVVTSPGSSGGLRGHWCILKLTSHGILHYLCSADLSKSFSQLTVSLFIFSQYYYYFFNKFCPVEKCSVTLHCLYGNFKVLGI